MTIGKMLRTLIGVPVLLVAACDDGPKTVSHFSRPELIPSILASASKEGPVYTIIHGSPFAGRDADTQTKVLATMSRAITFRKTRFTVNAAEAKEPGTRVIWAFGAAASLDARKLCRGEKPATGASGDKISVRAVFCTQDELLSDVSGSIKTVDSADDPLFDKLISQVIRNLLDKS